MLTRLLLALLLGGGVGNNFGLGPRSQLGLVLCRDIAVNCALYSLYCSLPVYSLCMRTHCAATCGLCGDGNAGGLLGPALLISLLGLNGGGLRDLTNTLTNNINNANVAIRAGAPPIKEEEQQQQQLLRSGQQQHFGNESSSGWRNRTMAATTSGWGRASKQHQQQQQQQMGNNIRNGGGGLGGRGGGGLGGGGGQRQLPFQHQFAVPPGLQIPDWQTIRTKLVATLRQQQQQQQRQLMMMQPFGGGGG